MPINVKEKNITKHLAKRKIIITFANDWLVSMGLLVKSYW